MELTIYATSPKPRFPFMFKNDALWQKLDEGVDEWDMLLRKENAYRTFADIIMR